MGGRGEGEGRFRVMSVRKNDEWRASCHPSALSRDLLALLNAV